jgi:hypothetical protein
MWPRLGFVGRIRHRMCWHLPWRSWEFLVSANNRFSVDLTRPSAFKYCCRARGEKLEKTKISYACLARVVREGGFKIALIARLSAIPGHCMILSLCKSQLVTEAIVSHYCCVLNLWNGHHRFLPCGYPLLAEAIHHGVPRCDS